MRGARRPEDLAREAVLQLHRLPIDDHLLGPGGRPVAGTAIRPVYGNDGRVARQGEGTKDGEKWGRVQMFLK